ADRNRSHWSTSKTPSYTKSVSWQHHPFLAQLLTPSLRNFSSRQQLCGSFIGSMSKRIMVTDKKTTE
ncbi:hypothetical protein PO572_21655, partial [Escherichia coli]